VVAIFVLVPIAFDEYMENPGTYSKNIGIRADHAYYSPHISSDKGLHLVITNLSGTGLLASRHTWSADYGYFIRVIPSTSEVIILGNPVSDDNNRDIYWTWSDTEPAQKRDPVTIRMHLYDEDEPVEIANASLNLTWYTSSVVQVGPFAGP
jgi:hypothetical protein